MIFRLSCISLSILLASCGGGGSDNSSNNNENNLSNNFIHVGKQDSSTYINMLVPLATQKLENVQYTWTSSETTPASKQSSNSHIIAEGDKAYFYATEPGTYKVNLSLSSQDNKPSQNIEPVIITVKEPVEQVNCVVQQPANLSIALTPSEMALVTKEDYVNTTLTTTFNNNNFTYKTELRGRGNSTWGAEKKPYRIRLAKNGNSSNSLFDMPEARNWALLANYYDGTSMRNAIALCLGQNLLTETWTPKYHFTTVDYNGEYQGLYMLAEHVEIAPHKVNIPKDDITGNSFLVEVTPQNRIVEKDTYVESSKGIKFIYEVKNDIATNQAQAASQLSTITSILDNHNDTFFNNGLIYKSNYEDFVNTQSFVDYWIANDIFNTADIFFASTNMFKDINGKITYGPMWDYDLGAGNYSCRNVNTIEMSLFNRIGLLTDNSYSDPQSIVNNLQFKQLYDKRWNTAYQQFPSLMKYADNQFNAIEESLNKNFTKWPLNTQGVIMDINCYDLFLGNTPREQYTYLKHYLMKRMLWLDQKNNPSQYQNLN